MDKDARAKNAFTSHLGLYQFRKMFFGLTAAAVTFQRLMDCVLTGLSGLVCLVFLDDVIIYTKLSIEQHIFDVLHVLMALNLVGLKVKGRKYQFARKKLKFLGHVVSQDGVGPDSEKIVAVRASDPPTDDTGIRVFLGLMGFYRRFIKDSAKIAASMTRLLQKGVKFEWSANCQKAFDELNKRLRKGSGDDLS